LSKAFPGLDELPRDLALGDADRLGHFREHRLVAAGGDARHHDFEHPYSAELQRVAKETETETTKFVWDGQSIAQEYDELDVTQAAYTHDPRPAPQPFGDLVSQRRDTESSFYHVDARGSSRALPYGVIQI
jgi:hypothetical protein